METPFYLFLRGDGVAVPGPSRGPNGRTVQVPVRVAEPFYRPVQYLAKHLAAIAYFAGQRFRIHAGEPGVGDGVRPDLHPTLRNLAYAIGFKKPQAWPRTASVFPGILLP